MIIMKLILILIAFIYIFFSKADESIIIQSTTSTKNSGFFDYILPKIYKDLGIKAHVVAVLVRVLARPQAVLHYVQAVDHEDAEVAQDVHGRLDEVRHG